MPYHKCPVATCHARVVGTMLMCSRHWRIVPAPLKRDVWDQWNRDPHSQAHLAACQAATAAVDKQLGRAATPLAADQ